MRHWPLCEEFTGDRWIPRTKGQLHYSDVIMTTIASLITSLAVVYSAVYSDADQRKHQSSASLAFVWGIHRDRWIPRTKGQLRGKCFHLMTSSCVQKVLIIASGPLFTKRTDVFPQDLVKSRSREIHVYTFTIVLKFDRHIGSSTVELSVKFRSDTNIITSNLAASPLNEILGLVYRGPKWRRWYLYS